MTAAAGPRQPQPFVLASTLQGSFIVSRLDRHAYPSGTAFGVGWQLLERGAYDPEEVALALSLLRDLRRRRDGPIHALDCGANIGVHAICWGREMAGWGQVEAFEPQTRIFYALAGNIALNNVFNVTARHLALGRAPGRLDLPDVDYLRAASYGSLELRRHERNEDIGQAIGTGGGGQVALESIDNLAPERVDFMKIDVEGMEIEVLEGAAKTIARDRPILLVEVIKSSARDLGDWLEGQGYRYRRSGLNLLAIHADAPHDLDAF